MLALTNCVLVGVFFMLMAGCCFLHCWQNFGGEMTGFGDRQFYGVGSVILCWLYCAVPKAWWRCVEFRTFFRDWNLLVHDWIYCYVYQDLRAVSFMPQNLTSIYSMLQFLGSKYTVISVFATTFMSSLFHEYIIATGVKFFLPLLTIEFSGFGGTAVLVK